METTLNTRIWTITAIFAISACAAMNEGMNDVAMTFTSKEDRIAHWKEDCQRMGAPDESQHLSVEGRHNRG